MHFWKPLAPNVLLFLAFASMPSPASAAPNEVLERFLREAPGEYSKQDKEISSWQGHYDEVLTATIPGRSRILKKRSFEYYLNSSVEGTLLKYSSESSSGSEIIAASNGDYEFELRRNDDSGQRYMFFFNENPAKLSDEIPVALRQFDQVQTFHLAQFIDGSAGSVIDAKETEFHSRKMIRLEIKRGPLDGPGLSGFAIVDPSFHWAVVFWELRSKTVVFSQSNDYYSSMTGSAFPLKTIASAVEIKDPTNGTTTVTTFSVPEICNLPAEGFTLEHFGFPRPRSGASRSWFYFLNGLLLLIGTSLLVLYFVKRRHNSKGKSSTNV